MSGRSKGEARCPYCGKTFKSHGFGTHKAACRTKHAKKRKAMERSADK